VVNRNQILRHDFTCNGLRAGRVPNLHCLVERPDRNSTNRPKNFPAAAALKEVRTGTYAESAHPRGDKKARFLLVQTES
jgi:hypothetical protein